MFCHVTYDVVHRRWEFYPRRQPSVTLPIRVNNIYVIWQNMGWTGKDGSPSPLDTIIKILWYQYPFHQFRFKNSEQHLLLGSGGNQNLRPSCRRPPTRTFHPPPPVGTLRRDAPVLVRVRSPNDGNKLG